MSIAAIGYPTDIRTSATTTVQAPAAPRSAATSTDASLAPAERVPEVSELQEAVDSFNRFIPLAQHNLTFSIDDDSGQMVVKVIDGATQDVIRQIPSKEALAISRSLDQLKGMLLKGSA